MKKTITCLVLLAAIAAHAQTPVIGPSQSTTLLGPTAIGLYSSTANTGFISLGRTSAAGMYRVCGFTSVFAVGTAGTSQIFAGYTTDGRSTTPSLVTAALSATTLGNWQQGCTSFYADANTIISYSIVMTGVTGTPTFRYTFSAEKLF
jgi:hypothetical protein